MRALWLMALFVQGAFKETGQVEMVQQTEGRRTASHVTCQQIRTKLRPLLIFPQQQEHQVVEAEWPKSEPTHDHLSDLLKGVTSFGHHSVWAQHIDRAGQDVQGQSDHVATRGVSVALMGQFMSDQGHPLLGRQCVEQGKTQAQCGPRGKAAPAEKSVDLAINDDSCGRCHFQDSGDVPDQAMKFRRLLFTDLLARDVGEPGPCLDSEQQEGKCHQPPPQAWDQRQLGHAGQRTED